MSTAVLDLTGQNIDTLFDDPFYSGTSGVSPLVPQTYQVSIDGHPYLITPAKYDRVTVPLQRQSMDQSVEPGEQTLNVAGAWRRAQDNWFMGAGQLYLDNRFSFESVYTHSGETPSVRTRFWRSKGVNPWTEGKLSLLPEYHRIKGLASGATALTLYAEKPTGADGRLTTSATSTATTTHVAGTKIKYERWYSLSFGTAHTTGPTESTVPPSLATAAVWTSTTLATALLDAGTWTVTVKLKPTVSTRVSGTYALRVWREAGGVFTQIGSDLTVSATVTGSTWTTLTFTRAMPATQFGASTKLAIDLVFLGTSSVGTIDPILETTTVDMQLGATHCKIVTAGYRAATRSGPGCLSVGDTLYYWDGSALYETTNPKAATPTWTAISSPTGTSWPAIHDLATDGAHLYCALDTHGIAKVTPGSTTSSIVRPAAPTPSVTAKGTTGSTSYTYLLAGVDANGYKTLVGTGKTITNGNASLSATNYNEVTWTAVTGIVSWDVLKGTSAHAVATGITGTSFTDKGTATTSYTAPTATTDNFQASFVGYGNGWLLAGAANRLCSINANGSTEKVMDHFNATWTWDVATGSPVAIYVAGHAGTTSEVYGVQVSSTTFGLSAPYLAAQIGQGEIVNSLVFYQGLVVLATSLGVRMAQDSSSNGFLTVGAVINDLGGSKCLGVYGPYVWFGVSQFDQDDGIWTTSGISSGTGRLFLSEFSNPLLPAYTTDVMATTGVTGTVTSIAMLAGTPYFTVTGDGVWGPSGNVVSEGFLETGWVRYGTLEHKILVAGSVRHTPLLTGQSVQVDVVPFSGQSFSFAGSNEVGSVGPPEVVSAGNQVGDAFMLIPTLKRGTDKTKGPILRWWTCRAMVVSVRQDQIVVPILWGDEVLSPVGDGTVLRMTLRTEWLFLKDLEAQGAAFLYREGDLTYTCYIDQIELVPGQGGKWNDTQSMLEGLCIVKLLTVN